ncbi:MAG: transposase, partial [Rhodocyclaceae bacterium]|nr:transposase [Rhodocyclaceae bacterium]
YVVGLARNSRLQAMVAAVESDMKAVFDETGMTQRRFVEFGYGVRPWKTPRHCVARLA